VRTISLSEYFSPSLLRSYLLLLAVFAVTLGAYAQSSQVSGEIVDPAKAAIPGVSLTLTHVETGEQKHTLSSDAGYFSLPLLPTGHYELTAEKSGFESQRHTGIVVETGAITTVDVTLQDAATRLRASLYGRSDGTAAAQCRKGRQQRLRRFRGIVSF